MKRYLFLLFCVLTLAFMQVGSALPFSPINPPIYGGGAIITTWQTPPSIAIQNTPPGTPSAGNRYIVGAAPTGVWVGHANAIADYTTVWNYTTPQLGFSIVNSGDNSIYVWSGSSWANIGTGAGNYVPITTTVNGHQLNANIIISASDVTTGTLPAAQLPNPSALALGGIQSAASQAHKWIASISTTGVPSLSQPAFSDLSGTPTTLAGYGITDALVYQTTTVNGHALSSNVTVTPADVGLGNVPNTDATNASNISSGTLAAARLPNPSATTLGGIKSLAQSASNWVYGIDTLGNPLISQPAFTDISGTIAGSQLPAMSTGAQGAVPATGIPSGKVLSDNGTWITASGSGNVTGPGSSVDSQISLFNGIAGTQIKASTLTGILKASNGVPSAAVAKTDYAPATAGSAALRGDGLGGFAVAGFTDLSAHPTTVAGYGITDAVPTSLTINGHALTGNVTVSASDITTGTLPAAQLPNPGASSLGGVQSVATQASKWISSISTFGVPTLSQPTFTDLSAHPTTLTGYGITDALNRGANDFTAFTQKNPPNAYDVLLIEDSQNGYAKKYVVIGDLPTGSNPLWSTVSTKPEVTIGDFGYGATLASALTQIGSSNVNLIIPPTGGNGWSASTLSVIPANVDIKPMKGGMIDFTNVPHGTISSLSVGSYGGNPCVVVQTAAPHGLQVGDWVRGYDFGYGFTQVWNQDSTGAQWRNVMWVQQVQSVTDSTHYTLNLNPTPGAPYNWGAVPSFRAPKFTKVIQIQGHVLGDGKQQIFNCASPCITFGTMDTSGSIYKKVIYQYVVTPEMFGAKGDYYQYGAGFTGTDDYLPLYYALESIQTPTFYGSRTEGKLHLSGKYLTSKTISINSAALYHGVTVEGDGRKVSGIIGTMSGYPVMEVLSADHPVLKDFFLDGLNNGMTYSGGSGTITMGAGPTVGLLTAITDCDANGGGGTYILKFGLNSACSSFTYGPIANVGTEVNHWNILSLAAAPKFVIAGGSAVPTTYPAIVPYDGAFNAVIGGLQNNVDFLEAVCTPANGECVIFSSGSNGWSFDGYYLAPQFGTNVDLFRLKNGGGLTLPPANGVIEGVTFQNMINCVNATSQTPPINMNKNVTNLCLTSLNADANTSLNGANLSIIEPATFLGPSLLNCTIAIDNVGTFSHPNTIPGACTITKTSGASYTLPGNSYAAKVDNPNPNPRSATYIMDYSMFQIGTGSWTADANGYEGHIFLGAANQRLDMGWDAPTDAPGTGSFRFNSSFTPNNSTYDAFGWMKSPSAWYKLYALVVDPRPTVVASSATPQGKADSRGAVIDVSQNCTIQAPNGTITHDCSEYVLQLRPTGTYTIGWDSIYRALSGVTLPTTTTNGKTIWVYGNWNYGDSKIDVRQVAVVP